MNKKYNKMNLKLMIFIGRKSSAQQITDEKFKNVIFLNNFNFEAINGRHNGDYENSDILIDVAIPSSHKIPVFYVGHNIPLKRLQYIYPEFSDIILITPNHHHYKQYSSTEGCTDPVFSSVKYHIQKSKNGIKIDSLVVYGRDIEMSYYRNPLERDFEYHQQEEGKIKVYWQDIEKFPLQNEVISVEESVKFFEEKHKKKIHFYKKYNKANDSYTYFYTLEGLTKAQKLKFVLERNWAIVSNKSKKDYKRLPVLITPYWVDLDKNFIKN